MGIVGFGLACLLLLRFSGPRSPAPLRSPAPAPRTPFQQALREAWRCRIRAHLAVNDQFEREEAWDREGTEARDLEPQRRQLLALDRTGDLRRSRAAAARAAALAQTPDEEFWLANLRARIEELHALKARLQSLLDDTGFYARDPAKFAEVSTAFAKAEAALADAEGEWLRLAILREETGG